MPSGHAAIRDIVVQLTGSAEDEVRLAFATSLAQRFDAHLIGVHLHTFPDLLSVTDPLQSARIRELLEASDREADRSFAAIAARGTQLPVSHEWRRLHGLPAALGTQLAELARTADLFVGTRPYGDPAGHGAVEEKIVFGSGRGCLFLPPGGRRPVSVARVLIAWDGSREASRAVAEAMPILNRAEAVHVIGVATPSEESTADDHLARLAVHLRRHGLSPTTERVAFATAVGEQVEQAAHRQGADLIVMGAYGHGRMTEWIFGGATRHLLSHSALPILMAH